MKIIEWFLRMYSELTQKLNRIELESFSEALEVGIRTHLDWLSNVNKALVCNDVSTLHLCHKGNAYKRCQFGRWYHSVTNTMLVENAVFRHLGSLHKNMHVKVSDLIKRQQETNAISPEYYQEFIDLQSKFFEVLKTLARDSSESLGNIDFLTGLPNRRAFKHILSMENNRIKRSDITSSIAIADIDYFKKVNDTYGHDAGDKILSQVADIFRLNIREYDTVSRYGGEEFVFCLPEINYGGANEVIERIRECVEKERFSLESGETIHVTCSFGTSQFNRSFSPTEALSFADKSLYKAKEYGRNKVVGHVQYSQCNYASVIHL